MYGEGLSPDEIPWHDWNAQKLERYVKAVGYTIDGKETPWMRNFMAWLNNGERNNERPEVRRCLDLPPLPYERQQIIYVERPMKCNRKAKDTPGQHLITEKQYQLS